MTQTMLEYVLNSMYIAIISAGLSDHQRALANDTLFRCADLDCASRGALKKSGSLAIKTIDVFVSLGG